MLKYVQPYIVLLHRATIKRDEVINLQGLIFDITLVLLEIDRLNAGLLQKELGIRLFGIKESRGFLL